MRRIGLILIVLIAFLLALVLPFSCKNKAPESPQSESQACTHYVSIDGLWRVTPATSIKYPHGSLEPVLQIRRSVRGELTVQGCFLWDERFYEYWPVRDFRYIDSTKQLLFEFNEEGSYSGTVDYKEGIIRGTACWGEASDTNRIDFIRDENLDVNRLFVPYPSGPTGSLCYSYEQAPDCGDQLRSASLFEHVKDSAAFYLLIDRIITQEFGRLESLLVLKDQKLVLEQYFYGYDHEQMHPIHSCTKSITSLLLGIALENEFTMNTDISVFDFFAQLDSLKIPEKEAIKLKHVLTMTPGIPEEDDFVAITPGDHAGKLLSLPLESVPGEEFQYNNNCSNLLGDIIHALVGKQADEYALEVLFNEMGISEFRWERENGMIPCHSELHMRPRDMAKIGLLVLQDGSWNGEQLVPEEWIAESCRPHVAESEFFDYGYQWWYRSKQNRSWWEDPVYGSNTEHDMFLALGYGGQYIMVIRDLNMVVVTTSSDYNEENGMAHQKVPMVIEELVPLFE